jgi:PAS domain S-box-containing protein
MKKEIHMRLLNAFSVTRGLTVAIALALTVWLAPQLVASEQGKQAPMGSTGSADSISVKMVKNAESVVIKLNPKGELTFMNDFAQKFFGYPEKEILGKSAIGTIIPATESSGRALEPMIQEFFHNPERHITNINENIDRNGKRVRLSWVNLPILDEHGKVKEFLCIGNPIGDGKGDH